MRALPEILDASSDLLANSPQLKVTINRDQASRFGISAQMIDDTLYDAYGQRQVTQYYTQLNTSPVILEITPELQRDLTSLDHIYVKSPVTGGVVPLTALVDIDSHKIGPLAITHQGQFPAVTLAFNLRPGIALGQAVDAIGQAARDIGMPGTVIGTFQGNAQAFQASLSSTPVLIGAALIVVYIILGILYESFIHPLTILSTLPSAGVGALLALSLGGMDLSVIGIIGIILLIGIVKKNGIMLVDFAIAAERDSDAKPARCNSRGVPAALPPDPDDDCGGDARGRAACAGHRRRFGAASTARLHHGRGACPEPAVDALHHAGSLSVSRSSPELAAWNETRSRYGTR